jgi:hypothetical protein
MHSGFSVNSLIVVNGNVIFVNYYFVLLNGDVIFVNIISLTKYSSTSSAWYFYLLLSVLYCLL